MVGLVMKYAGGVQKGFAIMAGIVLTGFLDYAVEGRPLSPAKLIALPVVLISTYMHMQYPVRGAISCDLDWRSGAQCVAHLPPPSSALSSLPLQPTAPTKVEKKKQ